MDTPVHILRRFMSKVQKQENGCWHWLGRLNGAGYGWFQSDFTHAINRTTGKKLSVGAHRAAHILFKGPVPDGMVVMHSCDIRHCVNPGHLSVGTASDNMRDAKAKGRIMNQNMEKPQCINGHEFTPENTRYNPKFKKRACRICTRKRAYARFILNRDAINFRRREIRAIKKKELET